MRVNGWIQPHFARPQANQCLDPASPPKEEQTVLYCDQPDCLQNKLGEKKLTKTVTRVLKSKKGKFKCTQTRKQLTKYGYLHWPCPGTKTPVTAKPREPVEATYRCIDPNNERCTNTIVVKYNGIGDHLTFMAKCSNKNSHGEPTCLNKMFKPTVMIPEEAYQKISSYSKRTATVIKEGASVRIHDLKGLTKGESSTDLNGQTGTLGKWRPDKGAYEVLTLKYGKKLVRAANLELRPEPRRPTAHTPSKNRFHKLNKNEHYFPEGTLHLHVECNDCHHKKTITLNQQRRTSKYRRYFHGDCRESPHKGLYRVVETSSRRRRLDALIERFQRESERCIAS